MTLGILPSKLDILLRKVQILIEMVFYVSLCNIRFRSLLKINLLLISNSSESTKLQNNDGNAEIEVSMLFIFFFFSSTSSLESL